MPNPSAPTTSAAKNAVAKVMADIKTAELRERTAVRQLEGRYVEIHAAQRKPYERLPNWVIDKIVTKESILKAALRDADYMQKQEVHRAAVAGSYNAHNAAILEVSKAYSLFPPIRDFTGDPRAAGVNMVAKPWLPRFSRHEKRDETTGQWRVRNAAELEKERLANSRVGGGVAAALTRGNGVMELYSQAFATPDELALTIYHETSHWIDIAGKSGGFKDSDLPEISFRSEQQAYQQAALFAAQLGVNSTFHSDRAAQFRKQADTAEREHLRWDQVSVRHPDWIGIDRKGSLALAPAESDLSQGDAALLEKKFAEAGKKAAARERERTQIAHRAHDDQLRSTLVQLALRSCAHPGSVTQSELDALPRPYQNNFYFKDPDSGSAWLPDGIGDCLSPYRYLAHSGRNADELRQEAEPQKAPTAPIAVVVPPASPVGAANPPPFSRVLPQYKSYAVEACRAPERIQYDSIFFFAYDYSDREYDDHLIRGLKNGMGDCAQRLLDYLVLHKRRMKVTDALQPDAIRQQVAAYTPVYSSPGRGSPRQEEPGCEYDPNIGGRICPKSR